MRPISRLERRDYYLGTSQKIESINQILEETTLSVEETSTENILGTNQTIRFVFLDKKEIEFLILEQNTEDTILELTHSDIKKYKEGKYLIKTADIKNDSSIEIFELVDAEPTSMGKTKKIINIK